MMGEQQTRDRIRSGLVAFAAGDAAGVPWEGSAAHAIDSARIDEIPRRGDWPPGATSDDTALTMLVADYLADRGAVVDEAEFLTRLGAAVPGIRGIGPSTHAAVIRYRTTGSLHADTGDTNGAAMRALPIGWAVADDGRRRDVTVGLSRTTHGAPGAVAAACIATAMASAAVDDRPVLEAAAREVEWAEANLRGAQLKPISCAVDGTWRSSPEGVSLDAVETLAAVVSVARRVVHDDLGVTEALRHAIGLGGDTDTVAAIAGGIIGSRETGNPDIPWLARVGLPDHDVLDAASAALAALRDT
jgi:ADP-ribosylglycohydrolase